MEWVLEKRRIAELMEYPKNARILTKEKEKHLKKSLSKYGLIDKIIINEDNTIIGGHQRVNVLDSLGHTEVDCWVPPRLLNDDEIEELNIGLNLYAGEWDWDKLANEWDVDVLVMLGFDPRKFFDDPEPKRKKPKVIIEFDTKEMMTDAMHDIDQIQNRYECKVKMKA